MLESKRTAAIAPGLYYMARLQVYHPIPKITNCYVMAVKLIESHDDSDMWLVQSVFYPAENYEVHASALTPESDRLRVSREQEQNRIPYGSSPLPSEIAEAPTMRIPRIPKLEAVNDGKRAPRGVAPGEEELEVTMAANVAWHLRVNGVSGVSSEDIQLMGRVLERVLRERTRESSPK